MRFIKHIIEFYFLLQVFIFVNILPLKLAYLTARILGRFAYKVWGSRRRVAKTNIRLCFPDMAEADVDRIACESFEQVATVAIEMLRMWRLNEKNISRYLVLANPKSFEIARDTGKGGLLITGHIGCYEMLGVGIHLHGFNNSFLVGDQSNKLVDSLMNWTRHQTGVGIIRRDASSLKQVIKQLRSGGFVAFVTDQEAGEQGVKVDFFGHPISAPKGPVVFALKTGAAICCAYGIREEDKSRGYVEDPIWTEQKFDDKEENITYWTQITIKHLENRVRQNPGSYMWMHKRFKSYMPEIYENMKD